MTLSNSQQSPCFSLLSAGITSVNHDGWLCAGLLNADDVHLHCSEMSSQACLVTSWFTKGTYTALSYKRNGSSVPIPSTRSQRLLFFFFNLCLGGRAHM